MMAANSMAHEDGLQGPVEVVVQRKGNTHRIRYRQGETLLETLRRGGVLAASSCEQGMCATCMVRCLKGVVELRQNHVLTERDLADGYTLACQGVPISRECEIELE
jgi:ferredoxin